MTDGKPASIWLAKVTEDQNLEELSALENVPYDTRRRAFLSAILQPGITFGHYDINTDRIRIGSSAVDNMTALTSWNTASVAALTLTCPAGHRYHVIGAAAKNGTQNSTHTLTGVIGGNTITDMATSATGQTMFWLIGGGGTATITLPQGIWMDAGDTLTITSNTCNVGVDDMQHLFIGEDYRFG